MKVEKLPVTAYDIVSYFAPGALLILYCGYGFHAKPLSQLATIEELNTMVFLTLVFLFVVASYVIGHAIALLAAFTLERLSLGFTDYPSKYLADDEAAFQYAPGKWGKSVCDYVCRNLKKKRFDVFFWLIGLLCLPFSILLLAITVFRLWGYLIKSEEKTTIELLDERFYARFKKDRKAEGLSRRWFVLIEYYVFYRSERGAQRMYNYLNLYGFCRNAAMSFYAGTILLIISWMWVGPSVHKGLFIVLSLVCALMLFLGFIKFFRRYSHEAIIAFVVMEDDQKLSLGNSGA
ncbi:MAG: hypothetical protein C6Y20_14105 [Tagaea sp. CACIAM 22H2]|nr:hypothetical protein [Tagaea sp. CACIAM 22H2]